MTLQRLPNGSVRISRVDEWHLQALRRIPLLADPGDDEKALRRVFPAPFVAGDASAEQQEDWVEFVQPEMQALFEESLSRVASDLKNATLSEPEEQDEDEEDEPEEADGDLDGLAPNAGEEPADAGEDAPSKEEDPGPMWEVTIPAGHVEDWYRAMNQARLVLSAAKEAHRRDNDYIKRIVASGEVEMIIHYEILTGMCGWWCDVMLDSRGG